MEEPKKIDIPMAPCCAGTGDTAADCGCGAPAGRHSWIKTLIAAIIMLAAIGVGAYSLLAAPAANTSAATSSGGSTAGTQPSAPAASAPVAAPSCCGQAAGVEAAPAPACCGGAAAAGPAAPQPPCCGGANTASAASPPAGNPNCGASPPSCCGH